MFIHIYAILIFSCQLAQEPNQVPGTRFEIDLPADFIFERSILGYRSTLDASTIKIYEIANPYSFEQLSSQQVINFVETGIDTFNLDESNFQGYKSIQFNYEDSLNPQMGFLKIFGTDEFLLVILIESSESRLSELIEMTVKKGRYNEGRDLDLDKFLGFTVDYKGTGHKIHKKDANTINTREIDSSGKPISWLNLTRMPKTSFAGMSGEEAILSMKEYYFPQSEYFKKGVKLIDQSELRWDIFEIDHGWYSEFNMIGLIIREDFDILVMGGVNSEESIEKLQNILDTIRFEKSDNMR